MRFGLGVQGDRAEEFVLVRPRLQLSKLSSL